jgi:hypothetical protein
MHLIQFWIIRLYAKSRLNQLEWEIRRAHLRMDNVGKIVEKLVFKEMGWDRSDAKTQFFEGDKK